MQDVGICPIILLMTNIIHHPILTEIEAYIVENDITASVFGARAVRDPRFVFDLRAGREPRRSTLEKVVAFMRANPPHQGKAPKKRGAA